VWGTLDGVAELIIDKRYGDPLVKLPKFEPGDIADDKANKSLLRRIVI
jgi:hypothetical protein